MPSSDRQTETKNEMEIIRKDDLPTNLGPAEYFTGTVRIETLLETNERLAVNVSFEPEARTIWHTHPGEQILIITSGCGRAQKWGGNIEEIHPGDVVRIPAGKKHWHGATPTTSMTHVAIVHKLNGKTVDWLEQVSDDQYIQA